MIMHAIYVYGMYLIPSGERVVRGFKSIPFVERLVVSNPQHGMLDLIEAHCSG